MTPMLSPFTPLFFINHKTDGIPSEYTQIFAATDRILIQLIGDEDWDGQITLYRLPGHSQYKVNLRKWKINDELTLHFAELALPPGLYSVEITAIGRSECFRVTDDERILEKTTLIQYSCNDNRRRKDVIFRIAGMQYYFDFRVHGGFKDSGWTFAVDSEQFTTQQADICQLYGLESTQKVFTMGTSTGLPIWYGEMLNRILVCDNVYFDKERYVRKDASVPEVNAPLDGVNSFIFTQSLQKVNHLDPYLENRTQLTLRREDIQANTLKIDETTSREVYI